MPETAYLKTECPHCKGHIEYPSELAGQSVKCPHCKQTTTLSTSTPPPIPPPLPVPLVPTGKQTPPPIKLNYGAAVAALGIIAFFVILVVIIVVIIGVNHKSSPSAATPPVKTQVGLTASAVAITNLDDYTWPGVKVWINGTPLGGYKTVYDRQVAPGQRILIPLTDFARGDRRFNPVERKVTQVIVYVEGHGAPTFSFR